MIASLADLRYRPPDAWLAAFTEEARQRLPSMTNQDYGLLAAALAALAAPLEPEWLSDLTAEAGRKWCGGNRPSRRCSSREGEGGFLPSPDP